MVVKSAPSLAVYGQLQSRVVIDLVSIFKLVGKEGSNSSTQTNSEMECMVGELGSEVSEQMRIER
jgi:hypothetical protein